MDLKLEGMRGLNFGGDLGLTWLFWRNCGKQLGGDSVGFNSYYVVRRILKEQLVVLCLAWEFLGCVAFVEFI